MIRQLTRGARDLLYPVRCVHCGAFGELVCSACHDALAAANDLPRCPLCTARWDGELNCPRCYFWDSIDGAHTSHEMTGPARSIVHGLKYLFIEELAVTMARDVEPLLHALQPAIVLPVPLHRTRLRRRGFNQAEAILRHTDWMPGPSTLRRVRKTETQVGKRARERVLNVGGAFAYSGPDLAGATVVLVDDVITTGATANECARVLRDHGARQVHVVAYARASYDPAAPDHPIQD